MAHLVDLQSFSQMAAPGPALPDLLWNVRLHGHCLYRWVIVSHGMAKVAHPLTRGEEWEMAWRADRYSSAQIESPWLFLLFDCTAPLLESFPAHLGSPSVSPWLGWQRDLQQPQRDTNLSSEQEEECKAEVCKAFEKLLPLWNR